MEYLLAALILLIVSADAGVYLRMLKDLHDNGPFGFVSIASGYDSDEAFKKQHSFGIKSYAFAVICILSLIYDFNWVAVSLLIGCTTRYILCSRLQAKLKSLGV